MTINHFAVLTGYAVWGYLLLCIFLKLLADRYLRGQLVWKKKQIQKFFALSSQRQNHPRLRKRMLKYACNDLLFDKICTSYLHSRNTYPREDAVKVEDFMLELVHRRLRCAAANGVLSRCLTLRNVQLCGLHSERIDQFRWECSGRSTLEQCWLRQTSVPAGHREEDTVWN